MQLSDSTAHIALNYFLQPRAAEVRTADDLWDPLSTFDFDELAERAPAKPRGTAARDHDDDDYLNDAPQIGMSPWLVHTMAIVEEQQNYIEAHKQGEDRIRHENIVRTAQTLAALLSTVPAVRRPQLNFDDKDIPSFATATRDFYVHLTVDRPDHLTWYAEAGGNEFFRENVAFDGRRLPEELRSILSP